MMDSEIEDQIRKILQEMPERLTMAQDGVDISIQKEYLAYSNNLDFDRCSDEEISARMQSLFDASVPSNNKKETLVLLANQGTVEAYRTIERFLKAAEQELANWSVLALQECRTHLESDLLEQSTVTVITGLGGEDNKTRYFVVVCPGIDTRLTSAQKAILEREFFIVCGNSDSILEEIQVSRDYATMKMLIPLDVAVGEVIEAGIDRCNTAGGFLDVNYFVTNVTIPKEADILPILRKMRNREE